MLLALPGSLLQDYRTPLLIGTSRVERGEGRSVLLSRRGELRQTDNTVWYFNAEETEHCQREELTGSQANQQPPVLGAIYRDKIWGNIHV